MDANFEQALSQPLTVYMVRKAVAIIDDYKDDDEDAHIMEDALHKSVLMHVARGGKDCQVIAILALETSGIDFSRWCS